MERFTNDNHKFLQQLQAELLDFEPQVQGETVFIYSEIPCFLRYAFAYQWSFHTQSQKYKLRRKEWNAKYDHERFSYGIYNLDRLAVIEKEVLVTKEDENLLNTIKYGEVNTVAFKGIVLDGLMCKLYLPQNQTLLEWNIDKEMNEALSLLVNKMRGRQREDSFFEVL